jgi:O-antigen ligase
MLSLANYKERFHFSVNFYSLFLLAMFIPDVVGMEPAPVKYAYWGLKIILAIMVIRADKRSIFSMGLTEVLFLFLASVYISRIFIDVFISPGALVGSIWNQAMGKIDFIGYCIGILLAFSLRYDPVYHSAKSFNFFWISLSVGLAVAYFLAYETYDFDVNNVRYNANTTINSIMYGQSGCALALVSLYGMINNPKKLFKLLFFATLLLGLISIAKAGSRSPVVVFFLISFVYIICRWGKLKGILIVSVAIFLFILLLPQIISLLNSSGSSLAQRLTSLIVDRETSGRDYIYANTWRLIQEYPFAGSSYVIRTGTGAGGYPHNFILEVFMATGLIGFIPFVILLIISIIKSVRIISFNSSASWICLLYLQIVAYGMFSTGIYTSQDFWTLLFFFSSMNISTYYMPAHETDTRQKVALLKLQK